MARISPGSEKFFRGVEVKETEARREAKISRRLTTPRRRENWSCQCQVARERASVPLKVSLGQVLGMGGGYFFGGGGVSAF